MKGQEIHLEMTPLKSSQVLLNVQQDSVETQPVVVHKKERARSPDLGSQEMNPKEKLRPIQRSGE